MLIGSVIAGKRLSMSKGDQTGGIGRIDRIEKIPKALGFDIGGGSCWDEIKLTQSTEVTV